MANNYESEVVLGETYIDTQTGFKGVATGIFFYQHGCERVSIEAFDEYRKKVINEVFDAPRLQHEDADEPVKTTKTGGPARFGENVR